MTVHLLPSCFQKGKIMVNFWTLHYIQDTNHKKVLSMGIWPYSWRNSSDLLIDIIKSSFVKTKTKCFGFDKWTLNYRYLRYLLKIANSTIYDSVECIMKSLKNQADTVRTLFANKINLHLFHFYQHITSLGWLIIICLAWIYVSVITAKK